MARRSFSGGAVATTLASGISAAATSATIAASTGWPDGSGGDFYIVIDPDTASEEKILVDTRTGTTLNSLTRGQDGTSATSHATGAVVKHVFTATDADEANAHVNDADGDGVAHAASKVSFSPAAGIAATNVQGAIEELSADAVLDTLVDAKGDLIVATAADTVARLAVGSNDQVLTADSAQASGLKWATPSSSGIASTLVDAKGDLIVATAADTVARKAVGTDGAVLVSDSGQSDGLRWAVPQTQTVATAQTSTSTTYTDLATAGPAVTATVGASGMALVILTCRMYSATSDAYTYMGFVVSGATTLAADDSRAFGFRSASGSGQVILASRMLLLTGLTAGANTFTAKYRTTGATTNEWSDRTISVIPL